MCAFAALSIISCGNQDKQIESVVDKQTTMDDVIMSRRSIRKWQDKAISRDKSKKSVYASTNSNILKPEL